MSVRFIDLFAGIGGFHLAFKNLGAECILACENDKFARETYIANHGDLRHNFVNDANSLFSSAKTIPDFDILCAGFPCQSFSVAGKGEGLKDPRGHLFYVITAILRDKHPKAFFLENVRGLLSHNNGETFKHITNLLRSEGYSFYWKLIKASDHGLPQFRPRVYMVGFKDKSIDFTFPEPVPLKFTMSDILCNDKDREDKYGYGIEYARVGYTIRVGGRGSPLGDRRNWDGYLLCDGTVYRLTINDMKKIMGFPDDFIFPVSNTQAMKQLGNSVAIDVVQAIGRQIMECLK